MDPTTSFVMSLVAVIVSGFSVLASFWAIGQNSRYHPKPFIQATISDSGSNTAPGFRFGVVNMGRASAHDVRLVMRNHTTGHFQKLWDELELPVTKPQVALVSTVTGDSELRWVTSEMTGDYFPVGEARAMKFVFELTWRQWPAMKRIRRVRWRVTTDSEGLVTLHTRRERGFITTALAEIGQGVRDALSDLWDGFKSIF